MTAALQTYARTTKLAIDTLEFRTAVLKMAAEEVVHGPKQVQMFCLALKNLYRPECGKILGCVS